MDEFIESLRSRAEVVKCFPCVVVIGVAKPFCQEFIVVWVVCNSELLLL